MNYFLTGFVDELVKLGAFPQQSADDPPYDASITSVMDQIHGTTAKTGLKTGQPMVTAPATKPRAPTPLTTPNQMVDVASRSGG